MNKTPEIRGRCILDHKLSTWSGYVYEVEKLDEDFIDGNIVKKITGFSAMFHQIIPVKYIDYDCGDFRVSFDFEGKHYNRLQVKEDGYIGLYTKDASYDMTYIVVLDEELKDGISRAI